MWDDSSKSAVTCAGRHNWERLNQGQFFAKSRTIDWAVLMKRTWGLDVLRCPRCARRLRVLATLTDTSVVRKLLAHLHVRSTPLPRAPARDPTWQQVSLGFDADANAA